MAKVYQVVNLTLEAFESWLSQFNNENLVGEAVATETCPLAMYVRSDTGRSDVMVNPDDIEFRDHFIPLPEWAKEFVEAIDRDASEGDPVYAFEARLAARGKFEREPLDFGHDYYDCDDYNEYD